MINTKLQNSATEQNQDDSDKKSWFNNQLAWGASLVLAVPIAIAVAPVAVAGLGLAGGILATTAIGVGLVAGGAYLANSYEEKIGENVIAKYGSSQKELEGKGGGEEGARIQSIDNRLRDLERNKEVWQLNKTVSELNTTVSDNKKTQDQLANSITELRAKVNNFSKILDDLFAPPEKAPPGADVAVPDASIDIDWIARLTAIATKKNAAGRDAAAGGGGDGLPPAGGDGRPADDAALGIGHPHLRRLEPNEGNLVAVLREGGAGGGGAEGGGGRGEGDPAVARAAARDAARAAARAAALAAAAGDGGAVRPGGGEVGSAEAGGGGDGLLLAGGAGAGADAAARRRGDKPSEAAVPDPAAAILLPDGHGGVGGRRAEAPGPAAAAAGPAGGVGGRPAEAPGPDAAPGRGEGADPTGRGGARSAPAPAPAPGRGAVPAATGNSASRGV